MPIPNGTPSTAITISSLPFSVTLDPETQFTGGWYKYTPTDQVLGILGCNSLERDVAVEMWLGNDPLSLSLEFTEVFKRAIQWPVAAGTDVYFHLYTNDYVSGDEMTLSVVTPTNTAIEAGDLFISEDEGHAQLNLYDPSFEGFWPSIFYGPDGTLRRVDATIPATELGACLSNGKWGIIARSLNQIFIYDAVPGITEIGRFDLGVADPDKIVSFATDFTYFYMLYRPDASGLEVYRITDAGVVTGPIATTADAPTCDALGGGGNAASGVSRDGTILYYPGTGIFDGPIHRHNLQTDTPMADIMPPDPLDVIGEVIVLSDDTIVALYTNNVGNITSTNKIVHYDADGNVLQEWELDSYPWEAHHLCHTGDDSDDAVWTWTEWLTSGPFSPPNSSGYSRFRKVQLVDQSYLEDFTKDNFDLGEGPVDEDGLCGQERFGAPKSCPFMVMIDPEGGGGEEPEPEPEPEPDDDDCPIVQDLEVPPDSPLGRFMRVHGSPTRALNPLSAEVDEGYSGMLGDASFGEFVLAGDGVVGDADNCLTISAPPGKTLVGRFKVVQ